MLDLTSSIRISISSELVGVSMLDFKHRAAVISSFGSSPAELLLPVGLTLT